MLLTLSGVTKSHKLIIDTSSITKNHTLFIDITGWFHHACQKNASCLLLTQSGNVNVTYLLMQQSFIIC